MFYYFLKQTPDSSVAIVMQYKPLTLNFCTIAWAPSDAQTGQTELAVEKLNKQFWMAYRKMWVLCKEDATISLFFDGKSWAYCATSYYPHFGCAWHKWCRHRTKNNICLAQSVCDCAWWGHTYRFSKTDFFFFCLLTKSTQTVGTGEMELFFFPFLIYLYNSYKNKKKLAPMTTSFLLRISHFHFILHRGSGDLGKG